MTLMETIISVWYETYAQMLISLFALGLSTLVSSRYSTICFIFGGAMVALYFIFSNTIMFALSVLALLVGAGLKYMGV